MLRAQCGCALHEKIHVTIWLSIQGDVKVVNQNFIKYIYFLKNYRSRKNMSIIF